MEPMLPAEATVAALGAGFVVRLADYPDDMVIAVRAGGRYELISGFRK